MVKFDYGKNCNKFILLKTNFQIITCQAANTTKSIVQNNPNIAIISQKLWIDLYLFDKVEFDVTSFD